MEWMRTVRMGGERMNDSKTNGEAPQAALKEWASAIEALGAGEQILLMRKGGIVEETRDFRLVSPSFYLMPTYEHQRRELLKQEHQALVDRTIAGWDQQSGAVKIEYYAEAVHDLEIDDQAKLDKLRDYHIWTDAFADERLRWKRKQPLHVLLLRVYRLEQAIEIPLLDAYTGCKSWVSLESEMPNMRLNPVLSDEKFREHVTKIIESLD
jgi:hypothetical protein